MTSIEPYAPPGALVYTLEREISAYEGRQLVAVLSSRTAVETAVLDYWAEPGYGDHRLIVQAWRLGSIACTSRGVFRGDQDDWTHPEEGDGPLWREMDRP